MKNHRLYLCEKPDQGKVVAQALGGGQKVDGGVAGNDWVVTWGFGHLLTPYHPQDYDADLKKWSWEPLPIVPKKFLFKPKDQKGSGQQIKKIEKLLAGASEVVISTDPDREGELIAYLILNRLQWSGPTKRLWISDLTLSSVKAKLQTLKDASETKPLYWAAMARMYADWIVGMNMSRAATLKLAAYGAKPMSVGRVQTPVAAMIVDRERKIKNFKPEDFFELTARVSTSNGSLTMRHAPSGDDKILKKSEIEELRNKASGATGPIAVKTEAKKQAPPKLFELNTLQQEANVRFGWSAANTLKVMQALYETHKVLTYPRTDCAVLPEEHKNNFATLSSNLAGISEIKHLAPRLGTPVMRSSVYDDKKVTAHHAIVPTNKTPVMTALSADETKLYLLVYKQWVAAHLPDMEYLQTSISFSANGVPFKASGRQITKTGWKDAFVAPGASTDTEDESDDAVEKSPEDGQNLPPLKDGEAATANDVKIDSKKTKAPSRFTEKTLLAAMANIASFVEDPAAKKTLKETSGIGTPATRANVIETLKAREYIKVAKRQLVPTDTAFTLIDAMRKVAPAYADPVMTARWEDVLEEIASGQDKVKAFVAGIAKAVERDVVAIKDSNVERMAAPAGQKSKFSGSGAKGNDAAYKKLISEGTPLKVNYDDREKAKAMGARWDPDRKTWVAPKGADLEPFKKAEMA